MKPFFKSKKHYHKRLDEGVEELSELQRCNACSTRPPPCDPAHLALALIEVDSSGSERWLARWPRMFGAGAEMLSTIAGSVMTVVGVTFSMTLALASSAYAPAMTERSRGRGGIGQV